jgi:hypothetical protein
MVKKLSVEIQGKLKKIAEKMEVTVEEVEQVYEEKLQELVDAKSKGNMEKLALNKTMSVYRREVNKQLRPKFTPKAKAEAVYGIILGTMGFRDRAEEMRTKAKNYASKNGLEAARDKQLIDGDNNVLDQRQTLYGKENPNYLEPLKGKRICSNILIGLFKRNGSKNFRYSVFSTNDNQLARAWRGVKYFTPCQTFAIVKEDIQGTMKLNSSKAEDTTTIFKALKEDWDIKEIILEATQKHLTPIQKVEQHFKSLENAWDRFIIVRGIVNWINLDKPTPWGSIYMSLIDPESGLEDAAQVRCLIPDSVKVDFGEGSEVLVFGKTKQNKYKDRETGKLELGDVRIDVYGIYPIPGLTTAKESSEGVADDEDIEGWLD